MKFKWDKKYLYWGVTAFCVLALTIIFYYIIFHTSKFIDIFKSVTKALAPIIMGLVLAYLLKPVCNFFENYVLYPLYRYLKIDYSSTKTKKRIRGLAILITIFLLIYLLYIFFSIVLREIVSSIQTIVLQFPIYQTNVEHWADKLLKQNSDIEKLVNMMIDTYSVEINTWLNDSVLPQMNILLKEVSLSLIGVIKTLWNMIIGIIVSIYVLNCKEQFAGQGKKIIYAMFNKDIANGIISDIRYANKTFGAFISGKIVDSIIIGFICFFLMQIFNLNYPVLISVIIGVTNVIPFFGPFIGGVPSILLLLMVDPMNGLKFALIVILIQAFDGNILGPKILGDSTGLNSFWVIFSITLFGAYFGVLGMAIGVPIFALIYAGLKRKINHTLTNKGLTYNTKEYQELDYIDETNNMVMLTEEKISNRNKNQNSIFTKIRNKIKSNNNSNKKGS